MKVNLNAKKVAMILLYLSCTSSYCGLVIWYDRDGPLENIIAIHGIIT